MTAIPNGLFGVIARKNAGGGGPVDEANLTAWFKADGVVYNTGTTQATNGQTVDKWVDATGNGHDIVQTTAGNRPLFITGAQNSLPGLQFVSSDWLEKGSAIVTAAPYTIYAVAKSSSTATQFIMMMPKSASGSTYFSLDITAASAINHTARGGGTATATTSTAFSLNTAFLATGKATSASSRQVRLNGAGTAANGSAVTPAGVNQFALGMARDSSPNQPLVGFIYEFRLYNVAHDDTTRDAVEAELNSKWAI
tara:strand:+ start:2295 stop:3053 length:759 start_codon:yes stop_codon:yes gene_type:complete